MTQPDKDNFNNPRLDDEINLRELFNILWAAKRTVILITSLFAIGSVVYSLSLTNYYKSESLLSARSVSETQGLSQLGGLAAMAGVNLSSGESKASQMMELIKSRKFVKHLITFDGILPSIMAVKGYDTASQELIFDQKVYDSETKTWKRKPKENGSIIPSYLEAHTKYSGMMSISQDTRSGFITISIEHISPVFAKEFLDLIIRESNELLRKKDMEESVQGLDYLTAESLKTPIVEMKESINNLIETLMETKMLTQIHQDYILIKIEPPYIPEKKSKPIRSIICILGTIFGGILSVMFVFIRHYFSTKEEQVVK